jgi:glutaminyl-peptide cyclotransferase
MTKPLSNTVVAILWLLILVSCGTDKPVEMPDTAPARNPKPTTVQAKVRNWSVVRVFPHDSSAFTQGLIVRDGQFLESTGQYGQSSVRRVSIATGAVRKRIPLDASYFGEGLTELNGTVYVLTWQNQKGLKLDAGTLNVTATFTYAGEGWGLTTDGNKLYMSNGSDMIAVHREGTFAFERFITVTLNGSPLRNLNELEWIDGALWANVWQTDQIVRIDTSTGFVTDIVDLTTLYPQHVRGPYADVLNGIAYDAETKALYVTGKNWPTIFQIAITP